MMKCVKMLRIRCFSCVITRIACCGKVRCWCYSISTSYKRRVWWYHRPWKCLSMVITSETSVPEYWPLAGERHLCGSTIDFGGFSLGGLPVRQLFCDISLSLERGIYCVGIIELSKTPWIATTEIVAVMSSLIGIRRSMQYYQSTSVYFLRVFAMERSVLQRLRKEGLIE
jgi:hypothetical protein